MFGVKKPCLKGHKMLAWCRGVKRTIGIILYAYFIVLYPLTSRFIRRLTGVCGQQTELTCHKTRMFYLRGCFGFL